MVFDLSSGSSKKKPAKAKAMPSALPASFPSIEDAQEMLKKMTSMHTELVKRMDETFQKTGIEPSELAGYCQDPSHFLPSQWEHLQTQKEEIETKLSGLSSEKLKKQKKKRLDAQASKGRKGKMLGARRQWLNMH